MFAEQLLRVVHYGHHKPATRSSEGGASEPEQAPRTLTPALRVFDAPGLFVGDELTQVGAYLLDWPSAPSRRMHVSQ